jgi:polyvinyl alcohol dehydrogenase (cytochrome)
VRQRRCRGREGHAEPLPLQSSTRRSILWLFSSWNGWRNGMFNTRHQSAAAAGLTAKQVPQLKLKWAFSFPYCAEAYGQLAVVCGHVFVGSDSGYVYSLDAATACVYWSFQADAGVRTSVTIGPLQGQGSEKYAAYFGDGRANAYAINASTGQLLWKTHTEDHPFARITGSPTLYQDRLYVPVASAEEGTSTMSQAARS